MPNWSVGVVNWSLSCQTIHKPEEVALVRMDVVQLYVKPVKDFAKDSMRLVKRCTKPDLKGT